MRHFARVLGALFASFALASCAAPATEAPLRSPTRDYPPPTPATADGEPMGADGVAPAARLQEGPRVGTENALGPGWTAEEGGLHHDPKARVGGNTDRGSEEESGHQPPPPKPDATAK